jgi:ABC-type antimicrobial peptide transport system permease subunit
MDQSFAEEMLIVARAATNADIAKISPALRTIVADVDPTVPVGDVHPLEGFIAESAARARFAATLLALFAAVALLLAATGIYGVTTAGVSRRTREIGVRMALGATSRGVLRMVLQETAIVTAVGVVLGAAGAIAAGALLRGLLYGVGAIDLPVLTAVAALLIAVALLAALVPARRASRIDPLAAIRAE